MNKESLSLLIYNKTYYTFLLITSYKPKEIIP